MKYLKISLLSVGLIFSACAKPGAELSRPAPAIETQAPAQKNVCLENFRSNMNYSELAVAAYKIKQICKISDDEVLQILRVDRPN